MSCTPMDPAGDQELARPVSAPSPATRRARDVMTRDVATCRATDTLERCARLLWDRACGCIVVVGEAHRPVAMITDRDICMAAYTQGKVLADLVVGSAMSRRLFTVDADTPLDAVERVMRLHCVRRLPVIDGGGALIGLISIADIAANAPMGPTLGRDGLSADVITATVAALHHSVRPSAV